MTVQHIPFQSLGAAEFGWLSARHHFSFGDYHDADRMGVGALRVWNDDEIAPGSGFPPHPHRDMEIVTFVRDGAITHEDNLGNSGRTEAGDVQVMSAGRGIVHGEYNRETAPTRLFQIWFLPRSRGGEPWWETRRFPERTPGQGFAPLASGFESDRAKGAIPIDSDAGLHAARFAAGDRTTVALADGEHAYLVAAKGGLTVDGVSLGARDAARADGPATLEVKAETDAEAILAIMRPPEAAPGR